MGRKLTGAKPKPATLRQRRWRAKVKRRGREPNARGEEWGTPPDYIDAARTVMGSIDLDPATHLEAQQRVQATSFYTAQDDGLSQPWRGRVWLNPPYSRGLIDRFADKLMLELAARRTAEAIVLVNAQTSAQWFHRLLSVAAAHCLTNGRIRFLDTAGRPGNPQVGQAILYFGLAPERFGQVFAAFGAVTLQQAGPFHDAA